MVHRTVGCFVAGAILLACANFFTAAADKPKLLTPQKAPADPGANKPIDLKDEAFDPYIKPDELAQAFAGLDPEALVEIAFKLLDAERAVGRPHKKVSGDQAFDAALRVAIERKSLAAMQKAVLASAKMKAVTKQQKVDAAGKLMGVLRA